MNVKSTTLNQATSDLVLMDIKSIILQLVEQPEHSSWLHRSLQLLMAIQPVAIFQEQTGTAIDPLVLMDLTSLEQWIMSVEKNAPPAGTDMVRYVRDYLSVLPGYDRSRAGQQHATTREKYDYQIAIATNLCDAAKSHGSRIENTPAPSA